MKWLLLYIGFMVLAGIAYTIIKGVCDSIDDKHAAARFSPSEAPSSPPRVRLIRQEDRFVQMGDETSAVTATMSTTQQPVDPRKTRPVRGLTEYVPIYSKVFLPPEHQLDLVTMSSSGDTNLQIHLYNGQLVLEAPNGLLPPRSAGQIYKLGIYTGPVRGVAYYEKAIRAADTRPLAPAILVREPGNQYDRNAVAIHAHGAGLLGYVNKQNAARLSKRLDAGADYTAIFTSGSKPGDASTPVSILIAPTPVLHSILNNSGLAPDSSSMRKKPQPPSINYSPIASPHAPRNSICRPTTIPTRKMRWRSRWTPGPRGRSRIRRSRQSVPFRVAAWRVCRSVGRRSCAVSGGITTRGR